MSDPLDLAREIVAEAPYDENTMRALAALCDRAGYDEDGIRKTYRAYRVAKALLEVSGALVPPR
jgi:hypothetical protein